jgi:cation transport protein ChaC
MLALDRGGSCRGVVFRLPPERAEENLTVLLRRERPIRWQNLGVRWVNARTDGEVVRALAFPISRSSASYLPGLTEDVIVESLATAAGERGSMAEYLRSTVEHLEERGIHDQYLWRMQERVAKRLERCAEPAMIPVSGSSP